MIKRFGLIFTVVALIAGCNENGSGNSENNDSANTDSLTNATYNPRVTTDSGAMQMNLDSTQINDSATHHTE